MFGKSWVRFQIFSLSHACVTLISKTFRKRVKGCCSGLLRQLHVETVGIHCRFMSLKTSVEFFSPTVQRKKLKQKQNWTKSMYFIQLILQPSTYSYLHDCFRLCAFSGSWNLSLPFIKIYWIQKKLYNYCILIKWDFRICL